MSLTLRSLLMGLSSLMLAGLLLLGFSLTLAQENFYKKTRITMASDISRDSGAPSLNANGTKIVFHSDSDFFKHGIPNNQFEIWLYDTTTKALTQITTASAPDRDSSTPSLNADGTKIAFISDSDFLNQGISNDQLEIWLYDIATTALTRVTFASHPDRDSGAPSLNADGTKIAFPSDSDFLNQGISNDQLEIWLYDIATTALTRVTFASHPDRRSLSPSLNADGTKIAFSGNSDFLNQGISQYQDEIWLYDTTMMTLTRVTTASGPLRRSFIPSMSADGAKIAFSSDSDFFNQGLPNDQHEIWLYDTTTMTLTRVTTGSESNDVGFFLGMSADGTAVAFTNESDFEIWLYDTMTKALTRVTTASSPGRYSIFPSLNSDGTQVTFESRSDFLNQGIPQSQDEIWLFEAIEVAAKIYLPVIVK